MQSLTHCRFSENMTFVHYLLRLANVTKISKFNLPIYLRTLIDLLISLIWILADKRSETIKIITEILILNSTHRKDASIEKSPYQQKYILKKT